MYNLVHAFLAGGDFVLAIAFLKNRQWGWVAISIVGLVLNIVFALT